MKKSLLASLIVLFALTLSADVFAQTLNQGCWGRADRYNRLYNPDTVGTISGPVTDIEYFTPAQGMTQGVHLFLRQQSGEITEVHLGPRWFLDNQDFRIQQGDSITVTGSRVSFNGHPVVIASEVTDNGQILRLRDEQGYPLWAGWRQEPK